MKIYLLLIFLTLQVLANPVDDLLNKMKSNKDFINKYNSSLNYKQQIREFYFESGLPKKSVLDIIKISHEDKNYLDGIEKFYNERRTIKINDRNESIPKWRESLALLKISSDKGNVLAGYVGLSIINVHLMLLKNHYYEKDKTIDILGYLDSFTKVLMKKNLCIGYLYGAQNELNRKQNTLATRKILEKGYPICKSEEQLNVPEYIKKGVRLMLAKLKVVEKVRLARKKSARYNP